MKSGEKGLSAWGLTMMALGTVVGGSFFLGSAIAIHSAGPSIIFAYLLIGALIYFILYALSEMTVADTEPGSFRTFAERAFGPGVGFVVGWVYWTGLVLAMSSEATAAAVLLKAWFPNISIRLLGTLIIVAVTLLNLLGAEMLSKLESGLAAIKLLAIVGFIVLGISLITGIVPNVSAIGLGVLPQEPLFARGPSGLFGSLLIVMFSYAGFEVIGLAAAECKEPHRIVPRAIRYTVIALVGLYSIAVAVLLPLIPTGELTEEESPFVAALELHGINWAAGVINIILVTAILSTMLAAMFGLGRMMRSLAEEGYAPKVLKDRGEIPYRGILFSGLAMLLALGLGLFLPKQVYIFLISSGGFSILFTYFIILITHNRFRKKHGCPPSGKCQLPGYPYTSWIASVSVLLIIVTMPLIPGQGAGLMAGIILLIFYTSVYIIRKISQNR